MTVPFEEICARHGVKPRGALHLGAHVGQEAHIYAGWQVPRVAWVEANPDLVPELRKRVEKLPGHTAHEAAIWDVGGQDLLLHVASNGGSSSLLWPKLHFKRYPEVTFQKSVRVRTQTVDGLVAGMGAQPSDFDFLNMDLQGAEGRAIAGMPEQLRHLRWIYTEVNFEELYEGCCLEGDLRRLLEDEGFDLAECRVEGNGWGEALFAR